MSRSRPAPDEIYERIGAVVSTIPPGRVATYGQVAALAGLAGHARQVGYAMGTLPDGSPVPWQRVINARGEVSRRAGEDGLGPSQGFQRHLLEEEGVVFTLAGQIDLDRYGWTPGDRPPRAPRFAAPEEIAALDRQLKALGSKTRAAGEKKYLKSALEFRGVSVPALRRVARGWLVAHPEAGRSELLAVARVAWRTRVHELRSVTVELLVARSELLDAHDLPFVEWMLRRAGTWAHVDVIAAALAGAVLDRRRRETLRVLDRWSRDPDFWLRRSALLALLGSLRREDRDWLRFARYADRMLDESEFFVRKAIGWVLREVSKRDPTLVVHFVEPRLERISGVTFREAVRRLGPRDRRRLERGYRNR